MIRKALAAFAIGVCFFVGAAAANYAYRDGNGTLQSIFSFVCQGTAICPSQVLIDSTGTEKATLANPLRIDPTGTTAQPVNCISGCTGGGNQAVIGPTAAGSAPSTSPIYFAGWDGTDLRAVLTDGSGRLIVNVNGAVAVTGTFWQATQPVSIAAPVSVTGSNVGGYDAFISTNPTIQNASYVAGNCMGGFQAVAAARTSSGSGILNKFTLISKGGLLTAKQVYVFSQNPSSSTCTDKSTFTIAAADLPKLIATFSITPAVPSGGSASEAENSSMQDSFVTSGNQNIYFAIVETTTETPASTSDLIFNIGVLQD